MNNRNATHPTGWTCYGCHADLPTVLVKCERCGFMVAETPRREICRGFRCEGGQRE